VGDECSVCVVVSMVRQNAARPGEDETKMDRKMLPTANPGLREGSGRPVARACAVVGGLAVVKCIDLDDFQEACLRHTHHFII